MSSETIKQPSPKAPFPPSGTKTSALWIRVRILILCVLFYLFWIFRFFDNFPSDICEHLDVEEDVLYFWDHNEGNPRYSFFFPLYFLLRPVFFFIFERLLGNFDTLLLLHVVLGAILSFSIYWVTNKITKVELIAFFATALQIVSIPEFITIRGFPTAVFTLLSWCFVAPAVWSLYQLSLPQVANKNKYAVRLSLWIGLPPKN